MSDKSSWCLKVRMLMRDGYGVEDVAVILECDVDDVRDEVKRYYEENRIGDIIWRPKRRRI